MYGRARLASEYSEIKIKLKFAPNAPAPNFETNWNLAPTEPMLVAIRSVDGERVPRMMKWGLIPHWAKDPKLQYSTINARAEDFATKPSFRDAWKWGQRCLVVTDGFYEWKKLNAKEKQPYAIGNDERRKYGDGWSLGEVEISDRRGGLELHNPHLRTKQGDRRTPQ
jgi:putative SOS response-associated peptidase YedK